MFNIDSCCWMNRDNTTPEYELDGLNNWLDAIVNKTSLLQNSVRVLNVVSMLL